MIILEETDHLFRNFLWLSLITNTITLLAQVNRYWRRCWPVESLCRTLQQILKKPGKLNSLGVIDTRSQDTYLFGTVSFFFFEYFEICSKFRLSQLWRNLSSRAGYFDFHVCGLLIHRTNSFDYFVFIMDAVRLFYWLRRVCRIALGTKIRKIGNAISHTDPNT